MLNNFFTVADLNYSIVALFSGIYLITIKDKIKNLYHLVIFLFALGTMSVTYFLSSNFIIESLRFHRIITVTLALLGTLHLFYFLINYPKSNWKVIPKILFYVFYIIDLILIILFIIESLKVGKIYKFDGHFWDVDEYKLSQIVGLFIVINGFMSFFTGIIRSFIIRNFRIPLLLLSLGIFLTVILPAVTNLLNRVFIISREEHQNIWAVFGNLGCFIILVTYVNYTREKTTLLSKLYAISLTSVLIILQFVNFFVLQERDRLFDLIQSEKSRNAILHFDYKIEGLKSIILIDPNLEYRILYDATKNQYFLPYMESLRNEFALMFLQLSLSKNQDIPKSVYPYLSGYMALLENNINNFSSNQDKLEFLYKNKRKFQILHQTIQSLSEEKFREEYKKLLKKYQSHEIYKYFLKENSKSKQEALQSIPILQQLNQKKYIFLQGRFFWDNTFVGYYYNLNDRIYLVLYEYHYYRIFISKIADILFYIITIGTLLILIGYPIFFLGSVLEPLKKLVSGLQSVEQGDLSIRLSISTNDELGYVTRIFNQMVESIKEKNEKLEEYANHLEQKVIERTKELEKSLKEIETLKEKQDGDYFLTSLLVKPLNSNEILDLGNVKTDFIIRQYKNFKFRKWESEIGGDFCTAKKIILRGKTYSFIINADAMGKSIQGAGGSLILGSVLKAIVERTNYQEEVKQFLPEKWLKYTFVELRRVFDSLNGNMLVSLIMLLIDEETGFIYFMNAEHPDIVLFRNQKASYIKPKEYLKKLGLYAEGLLSISTLQLQVGDVLFLGSDGKDDIVIEKYPDGSRKINMDDNLFLNIVENSQGNLNAIYSNLSERGEIIDDFSLIRIEYQPEINPSHKKRSISLKDKEKFTTVKGLIDSFKIQNDFNSLEKVNEILTEFYKKYPKNIYIKKLLFKMYTLQKKFVEAITILEEIFWLEPSSDRILYKLIKLLKNRRLYLKAAEYGEIYLLRNPDDKEMISTLINLYKSMNHPRYKKLEKYLQIPDTKIQ
ncbi:MAG: SpoIIE family protein phosphatase [Leptonema sp. (in: bacteria)]